jgi:hypothetical protein
VADPWIYNEYTNGHLPPEYDNLAGAVELVQWLVNQVPRGNHSPARAAAQ